MGDAVLILLLILFIIIGPFLTIWSLNTLFGLGIAYKLSTWFAALLLTSSVAETAK